MAWTTNVRKFGMGSLLFGVLVLVGAGTRISSTGGPLVSGDVPFEVLFSIFGAGFAAGLLVAGFAVLLLDG